MFREPSNAHRLGAGTAYARCTKYRRNVITLADLSEADAEVVTAALPVFTGK